MPRLYLPLAPVVILSAIVAVSACSKGRAGEEGDTLRVVPPPAAAYAAPSAPVNAADATNAGVPGKAEVATAATAPSPEPSAEEVMAFEGRGVRK
jgi:hypothetical protein